MNCTYVYTDMCRIALSLCLCWYDRQAYPVAEPRRAEQGIYSMYVQYVHTSIPASEDMPLSSSFSSSPSHLRCAALRYPCSISIPTYGTVRYGTSNFPFFLFFSPALSLRLEPEIRARPDDLHTYLPTYLPYPTLPCPTLPYPTLPRYTLCSRVT